MYSTAATKPASSSCCCVPCSKRLPTGSSAAGRTLYGRHDSSSSRLPNARPRCGPKNLYGEQRRTSTSQRGDVDRPVRPVVDGVGPGERAGAVRELDDAARRRASSRPRSRRSGRRRRASGSESCASRSSRSSVESSCTLAKRTTTPRSCASSSHGATFASWSSFVTTISSPARERPAERAREQEVERGHARPERDLVRVAAEEAGRRRRGPARSSSSVRTLVSYGAPMFALSSRR